MNGRGLDKENEIQRNDQGMRLLRPKVTKLVKEGQSKVGSPRLLLRDTLRQGGEARADLFKSWSPPLRKAVILGFVQEGQPSQRMVWFGLQGD